MSPGDMKAKENNLRKRKTDNSRAFARRVVLRAIASNAGH
jgi:hypothetical protein